MSKIDEALVERMIVLVRSMAECGEPLEGHFPKGSGAYFAYADAKAIAAELPKPVDPDLLKAREMASGMVNTIAYADSIAKGRADGSPEVRTVLAAIKLERSMDRHS